MTHLHRCPVPNCAHTEPCDSMPGSYACLCVGDGLKWCPDHQGWEECGVCGAHVERLNVDGVCSLDCEAEAAWAATAPDIDAHDDACHRADLAHHAERE